MRPGGDRTSNGAFRWTARVATPNVCEAHAPTWMSCKVLGKSVGIDRCLSPGRLLRGLWRAPRYLRACEHRVVNAAGCARWTSNFLAEAYSHEGLFFFMSRDRHSAVAFAAGVRAFLSPCFRTSLGFFNSASRHFLL